MLDPSPVLQSTLTCPLCGQIADEIMPTDACQYFYDCKGCGALLKPEDIVYDISEIAFFGAAQGDYYRFPLYVSKEKLEQLFTWSEGKGTSNITLRDWILMLYEQHINDMDAVVTGQLQ